MGSALLFAADALWTFPCGRHDSWTEGLLEVADADDKKGPGGAIPRGLFLFLSVPVRRDLRSASAYASGPGKPGQRAAPADAADELHQEVLVFAARRCGARDEVEHLAVLQAVIGNVFDPAVIAEIDGEHALIDDACLGEGRRAPARLRYVVEDFVVERRRRGR